MPATRRGIYHNLKESNYVVSNNEITFFFSSKYYMHKFLSGYHDNRYFFKEKLSNHAVVSYLNLDILADIDYYTEVEKRGFYAMIGGCEISCENIHQYALRKMTKQNTSDWYVTQKPKLSERAKTMGLT